MEEKVKIQMLLDLGKQTIDNTVQYITQRPEHLYEFFYLLRKSDQQDHYSASILKGNIEPNILIKIVMSNKWNGEDMNSTQDFKLAIGSGCSLKFDTSDA